MILRKITAIHLVSDQYFRIADRAELPLCSFNLWDKEDAIIACALQNSDRVSEGISRNSWQLRENGPLTAPSMRVW